MWKLWLSYLDHKSSNKVVIVVGEVIELIVVDTCLLGTVLLITVKVFTEIEIKVHNFCQTCTNSFLLLDLVCHIIGMEFYLYPFQKMVIHNRELVYLLFCSNLYFGGSFLLFFSVYVCSMLQNSSTFQLRRKKKYI